MGAFKELGKTSINDQKNLVISRKGDDRYAIAQQIEVDDGENNGKPMQIFLKNSIEVDYDGLRRIYEELGKVLEAEEDKNFE